MERAEFIARIRNRLGSAPRLRARIPGDWAVDIADPFERFEAELAAIGGRTYRTERAGACDVFAGILSTMDEPAVLIARENPVPDGIEGAVINAAGRVLRWPEVSRDEAAAAGVGVTGALWAVAETGTVVVSAAPPGGRAPSLLPPVHVAFVDSARLLPTVADLFTHIGTLEELPSNVVLVTGPSKSADIGMELVRGVHGPGEVHVVLMD